MVSFYPGPSAVYPEIAAYTQEAIQSGIISSNHRSGPFVDLCQKVISELQRVLEVPKDYTVFFTSSATECWEILAQSLIENQSLHVYNGAFGRRWKEVTEKIGCSTQALVFDKETLPSLPFEKSIDTSWIALTHTETSNGTALPVEWMRTCRKTYPEAIIAVDATSSLNGVYLPIDQADIWYASVQKCFGLPSGLGVMICSPKVREVAYRLGENKHYNSLINAYEMMDKFQTTHTPNILGIYLLYRTLQQSLPVREREKNLLQRAEDWYRFFETQKGDFQLLVTNETVRAATVIAIQGPEDRVADIKKRAFDAGFVLGNGYKEYAKTTFRIANFPAIEPKDILHLKDFLSPILSK